MNVLAAILAAAVPAAFYGLLIWWLDRYEKEPLWLILVAFLWGSLPAIGLAVAFELGLEGLLAGSPRLRPYLAVPHGDMMMAGCWGLVRACAHILPWTREAIEEGLARGEV